MLKQAFLAHFEPVVMHFGPWKIPKCLEDGPLWDLKWVKNWSKTRFSKSDRGLFGMLKQIFLAHFEPKLTLVPSVLLLNCPCCERQVPQDEALHKSRLLRAKIVY